MTTENEQARELLKRLLKRIGSYRDDDVIDAENFLQRTEPAHPAKVAWRNFDQCAPAFTAEQCFLEGYRTGMEHAAGIVRLEPECVRGCVLTHRQRILDAAGKVPTS